MSEPTRSTMTDNITAIFFSLFKTQILKRLFHKSQRSETSKSSIKEVKAPSEHIQEERETQERGLCPNLIIYPRELRRNQKEDIISTYKSDSLLESPKKIIKSSRSKHTTSSSTRFQLQPTWQLGFVHFSCIYFYSLVSGSWLALKPRKVVGEPWKPTKVVG